MRSLVDSSRGCCDGCRRVGGVGVVVDGHSEWCELSLLFHVPQETIARRAQTLPSVMGSTCAAADGSGIPRGRNLKLSKELPRTCRQVLYFAYICQICLSFCMCHILQVSFCISHIFCISPGWH